MSEQELHIHPILKHAPDALKWIKVLSIDYFVTATPPVPRRQEVPSSAFRELNSNSILVSTSHAWHYQVHPDPEGTKLKIFQEYFIPLLKKKFPPPAEILVFDDWHSCPQYPRTNEEDRIFYACMSHMRFMYVYCDVILFIEAPLPRQNENVHKISLVPGDFGWIEFGGTIQFYDNTQSSISRYDIIVSDQDLTSLRSTRTSITVSFLKRPYGKPNDIPSGDRGWLFAERFMGALKVCSLSVSLSIFLSHIHTHTHTPHTFQTAASPAASFHDLIKSNDSKVVKEIRSWTCKIRNASTKDDVLREFEKILDLKRFTNSRSRPMVKDLLHDLVNQFSDKNWKAESNKQTSMIERKFFFFLQTFLFIF